MKPLITKRILMLLPTAVMVALISFSTIYFAPGNAAELILHSKNAIGAPDASVVSAYEKTLGLDQSFSKLFQLWLQKAAVGDLGDSFRTGLPVLKEFGDRFVYTGKLIFIASAIYVMLGFVMGLLSAKYKDSILDQFVRGMAVFNLSVPSFWLALFLLWLFSIKLKIFPAFGYSGFISLVLPGFVMGISRAGTLARLLRTCVLEALNSPYVVTARATGMSENAILVKQILKNTLLPMITLIGMNTANLLGGSVIIENIFGLPGVGSYLIQAVRVKDFPVISGFILIFGMLIVIINLVVDLSYALIDPRVGYSENDGR